MSTGVEIPSNLANSTLLGRLQRGVVSGLILQLVNTGQVLVLTPLFLRAWGAEGYGRWLTLTAWVSYLILLNLGAPTYLGNLLAMAYAKSARAEFRKYFSEGVSLFVVICSLALVALLLLLNWPTLTMPGIGRPLVAEERWVLGLLGASYLLSILGVMYSILYQATGQYARGVMIGTVTRALRLCLFATGLYFQVTPVTYAILIFGVEVVAFLGYLGIAYHTIPAARQVRISLEAAIRSKAHLSGSFYFWLIALAGAINQQGVISVLAVGAPATAVAIYATHRTAAGLIRYPVSLLQSPLWPELGFMTGQARFEALRRISLTTTKLSTLASAVVALALWAWLPLLYSLWTGRTLTLNPTLLVLFLLQTFLFAGWSTAGWPLLAANRHRPLAISDIANAGLTIGLAVLLVKPLGMVGVAIATLTGDVLCGMGLYPYLASRFLGVSIWRIYGSIARGGLAALPLAGGMAVAALFLQGWGFALASSALGLALAYPLLALALGRAEALNLSRRLIQASGLK